MRVRIKKGIAFVLSVAISIATCITEVPQLSAKVYAAGTGKILQLGAACI